jgi:predicted MFS family arabinose efflux permease
MVSGVAYTSEALASRPPRVAWVIAATAAGTIFEWYDFYLCTILAPAFAKIFFPPENEIASFLSAFTAYAIGFIVRPFGALIFGRLGDQIGRKYTFLITIVFMGFSTFTIGLLPSFNQAGWLAPALLVFLRIVQGLAIGGEYGGAAVYVAEYVTARRRGLATGFIQATPTTAFLLAVAVINVTRSHTTEADFLIWGWRIPFLVSLLLLMLSMYLRAILRETPVFLRLKAERRIAKSPLKQTLYRYPNNRNLLLALLGIGIGQGVVSYAAQFYVLFFLTITLQLDLQTASIFVLANSLLALVLIPSLGWLSDRIGRLRIMLAGLLVAVLITQPAFHLLSKAVNPDLSAFQAANPIVLRAAPQTCRFHLFAGPWSEITTCDQVRSILASSGLSFSIEYAPEGSSVLLSVGNQTAAILEAADAAARVEQALFAAGYPGLTLKYVDGKPQNDARGNPVFEKAPGNPAKIDYKLAFPLTFAIIISALLVYAPLAAFLSEYFAAPVRYTSVSLTYHIANGWFGGMMPVIAASIVVMTGDIYAGLWYVIAAAAFSFIIGAIFLRDYRKRPVDY